MFSTRSNLKTAKGAAAAISKAVLEHNVACAREGVQMPLRGSRSETRAKDAKTAIAAAEHVVDAVARIMNYNKVGIVTLQRPALPGQLLQQPQSRDCKTHCRCYLLCSC